MRIELELISPGNLLIDLGGLCPSKLLSTPPGKIENLAVVFAGRPTTLGEHFKVRRSAAGRGEVVLSGDTRRILSAGRRMDAGRLVIEGNAGPFTGEEMMGGELEVSGNAGDCLGVAMCGGRLRVHGGAGDWCGAAQPGQIKGMTGGTIIVDGNVGAEAGAGMRRGLLVIGRDSGDTPGVRMLSGTIICLGKIGEGAGVEMKRGSLVAGSSRELLPGFRPTGADSEWLRVYLTWLYKLGLTYFRTWEGRLPKRFTGDHLVSGKGEVLVYDLL